MSSSTLSSDLRPAVKLGMKGIAFVVVNVCIAAAIGIAFSRIGEPAEIENSQTESSLQVIPEDEDVDLVVLGASHARMLSRTANHGRVEDIIDGDMVNMAKGDGGGLTPAKVYLEYFYDQGNTADTVLYMLDAFVLYGPWTNEDNDRFVRDEPFDMRFLSLLFKEGFGSGTLTRYIQSKVDPDWVNQRPDLSEREDREVEEIDQAFVDRRVASLYPQGMTSENAERYRKEFLEIVELAEENGSKVVVVVPPTLLGELPGEDYMFEMLEELEANGRIVWADHTTVISDPALYRDLDHLNTRGVEQYTSEYLLPLLRGPEALAAGS